MTSRLPSSATAALALLATLVLAGCSPDDDVDATLPVEPVTTQADRGIDAESYYDDYATAPMEDSAGGAVPYAASPQAGTTRESGPGQIDVPDPDEDNRFVEAGVNGFVATADDPRSTFALDVDTGSLGVVRALLSAGAEVPAAAVRPEEWVNAVPYADPAPSDADLGLVAESGIAPTLDDGTQVVRVGVGAREVDPADRPRANITLVVDRSGSMDVRERLGLVQSSLALLADRLRDDDTVSVVSFEEDAQQILEPTPVRDTEAILDAIEQLTPGGGTNLEAGLRQGYANARDAYDPDAVNLVVLCSDGVANIGDTGPGSITDTIAQEGRDGISLVTVGYGLGNYDDHLMEQLADLGDGFYSYVDTFDEAEQLFGTDLTTTLVPVAAEARAQVAFDPALVSSYRLIGYENREIADEDFDDLAVDAGELGSGHRATALYEVRLAPGVEPGAPIGTASVLWRPTGPDAGRAAEAQQAQVALVAADPQATPSDDLVLATTAADLAQLLKADPSYVDRGVTLDDLAARVDQLDGDGARELADLVDLARR